MLWFKYPLFDIAVCDNTIDCAVLVRWHKQNKLAEFWATHLNELEDAINLVYSDCDGDVLFDLRGCNMAIENPGAILLRFTHRHFTLEGYETVNLNEHKEYKAIFDGKDISDMVLTTEPVVKPKAVRQMRSVRKVVNISEELSTTRVL